MNKKEVIEIIGKHRWKKFQAFMFGQTTGIYNDGTTNYYKRDVENFLREPKHRFFD